MADYSLVRGPKLYLIGGAGLGVGIAARVLGANPLVAAAAGLVALVGLGLYEGVVVKTTQAGAR